MTRGFKKTFSRKFILILAAFVILLAAIFFVVNNSPPKFFASPSHEGVGLTRDDFELGVYFERIGFVRENAPPYREHRIEYPFLGVIYITLPALFSSSFHGFREGLLILNLAVFLAFFLITRRILQILKRPTAYLWLFTLPSFIYFIVNRFDIFPVLLIQAALLFLLSQRWRWCFLFLSLSFLAKGYAVVLFPIFFVYYLNKKNIRETNLFHSQPLWIMILPAAVTLVLLGILAGWSNALFPYIFQSSRSFSYGTLAAVIMEVFWNIFSPGFWRIFMALAAKLFLLLQIILPIFIYAGYQVFRRYLKSFYDVISWSIVALMLYIFFSPYYSPQWWVWLVPLLVLVPLSRRLIIALVVYDLSNYLFFPISFGLFGFTSLEFNTVVLARTAAFSWILFIIVRDWQQRQH